MSKARDFGYDFIRFLAMLLIVVHHFYTTSVDFSLRIPSFLQELISHSSLGFGKVGVALFFMLSGAVLIMTNKDSISEFYKKRLLRIEIPQILGFLVSFWVVFIVNKSIIHRDLFSLLISVLGLNYSSSVWNQINVHPVWVIGEWFTAVIIILYLLFPLLRFLFNNFRWLTTVVITVIFILNLKYKILSAPHGWFSITNGLMCFWVGCLFNEYKRYLEHKVILSVNLLLIILIWLFAPKEILGYDYLSCFCFSVLLFTLLYRIKFNNYFTKYICKFNYEIYLVHHRIYILFIPALLTTRSNDLQFVLAFIFLTAIVFGASEMLQKASNYVREKIVLFIR